RPDGGDGHRVGRELDGAHGRSLGPGAHHRGGTAGPGGGRAGLRLDQAETAQLADQVGDGRTVEARLLGQLRPRHGAGAVEPVEDRGEVMTAHLLLRHPSPLPPQTSIWRGDYVMRTITPVFDYGFNY